MSYFVAVKFNFSGDESIGNLQMVKTDLYFKFYEDGTFLQVKKSKSINRTDVLNVIHASLHEISEEEFREVINETLKNLDISQLNHKFIKK